MFIIIIMFDPITACKFPVAVKAKLILTAMHYLLTYFTLRFRMYTSPRHVQRQINILSAVTMNFDL